MVNVINSFRAKIVVAPCFSLKNVLENDVKHKLKRRTRI